MDRQLKVIIGSATGAFVIAAGVGVLVALQTSPGAPAPRVTAAAAGDDSTTSPSAADAPAVEVSTAPADPASCTIGEAGSAVQVTIVAPDPRAECAALGQSLAKSSGGFWQAEAVNGSLSLVCVMDRDSVSATVLDDGGEILGHALCSDFEASGWTEDTAAEQRIVLAEQSAAAAASASAEHAAEVTAARNAAASDLSDLQTDSDFSTALKGIQHDVTQTASDLAQEKTDAAQGPGDNCTNASSTVYNDAASTVYNDEQSSLLGDVDQVANGVAAVRKDEGNLSNALDALSALGLSAPSDASAAVSVANQAMSQAISQANAAIDTVHGDVASAYQIADGMGTGSCSWVTVPGSPPSPLTHLS